MTEADVLCHMEALKRLRARAIDHMHLAMDMLDAMLVDAEDLVSAVVQTGADTEGGRE